MGITPITWAPYSIALGTGPVSIAWNHNENGLLILWNQHIWHWVYYSNVIQYNFVYYRSYSKQPPKKGHITNLPQWCKGQGMRRRRWRPGTQALREVHNLMRMTNLLIPRTPFLWYVEHVRHILFSVQYSTHMYFFSNRSNKYKLPYFVNVLICI